MRINDVLRTKGSAQVVTVSPDATVRYSAIARFTHVEVTTIPTFS